VASPALDHHRPPLPTPSPLGRRSPVRARDMVVGSLNLDLRLSASRFVPLWAVFVEGRSVQP